MHRSGFLEFMNNTNVIVNTMLGRIIAGSVIVAGILLIIMLQTTNPSTVGPVGLLAVFFLLYVIMLGTVTEVLWLGSRAMSWLGRRVVIMSRKPVQPLTLARSYYFSTILALGPVILLAMASIGSLGIYETILVMVFLAVGVLYISKR